MRLFARLLRLLLALVALAGGLVASLRVGPAPELRLEPRIRAIGLRDGVVHVSAASAGRGLAGVRVELEQGGRRTTLVERRLRPLAPWAWPGRRQPPLELDVELGPASVPGLVEGDAVVRLVAERAATWLRHPAPVVRELRLPVLLRPPVIEPLSKQHNVGQGGAGVVLYRVSATAVRDGVRAGARFFPGRPLPGAATGERVALFGIPWDAADAAAIVLAAEDAAGNLAERPFVDHFRARPPTRDRIVLDDAFLERVVNEIREHTPGLEDRGSTLANYLAINRELRQSNAAELVRLAERSLPRLLWREPFLPPRGAQVMAGFADQRTYLYDGREVDQQTHLGFDLASTARTPVPAANAGFVVLARYLGIYGNTVVLDHGLGLQSLYSHLSELKVQAGERVERGAIVGLSGRSGLAGGDHLHFSMLLGGLPVTPLEWWDARWLRDHVAAKLAPWVELDGEPAAAAGPREAPATTP